jgi:AP-4 complex subunit mu-1
MISQFFILSARGDTLIVRDFRHDLIRNTPEIFYRHVKLTGDNKKPIFNKDGINFFFLQRPSLYLVCTSRFNTQPQLPLDLLYRIAAMIKDMCGVLTEEAIRKNFVLIYELIDEMVDFGYTQVTGTSELTKLIVIFYWLINIGVRPDSM